MDEQVRPLTETVYYILLALAESRHGYAVMQHVKELTGGRVVLGAGTLYGALSSLLDRGWIEATVADEGDRKKEYRITLSGRRALDLEITRLECLVHDGHAIMKGVSL